MQNKQILFTAPNVAELVANELPDEPGEDQVLIETEYTAISAGTERANLVGERNISGVRSACEEVRFPRALGYSGVGRVLKVGSRVRRVRPGERAIIYFGQHKKYNLVSESNAFPIPYPDVSSMDAALLVIACFPMEGVRKSRLELGESALVMGLGILGLFAMQLARIAGAVPVIAADPNAKRRELALHLGADVALDPFAEDFGQIVRAHTHGRGADVVVEVTGVAQALSQALEVTVPLGRVTLLGCTREPAAYDMYHQVHFPGISLIGAHNFARPKLESRPGNWTAEDDCAALLSLLAMGRLRVSELIGEVHSPEEAGEVYHRLAFDKDFPIGVLFDWKRVN